MSYIQRAINFPDRTFFLWGPRQCGKTTLLKQRFKDGHFIDLLKTSDRMRYELNPGQLREELRMLPPDQMIIIDEIQKVPSLLDEVQYSIQEDRRRFCLCGSSARKLKRSHANMLGGRALRRELLGFSAHELGADFSLLRMLNHGPLPPHYIADDPRELLEAYADLYLKEEILDEGLTRNLPVFTAFLRSAAIGDTEVTNFTNIARECGVASSTVRGYYEILEHTLIGAFVPAYTRRAKRRVVQAPKFYFRDVGIVNSLLRRGRLEPASELFGKAFENWVFHELSSRIRSDSISEEISYWRLSSGIEVDFVLGHGRVAIEAKAKQRIQARDMRHLLSFREEHPDVQTLAIVCLEPRARKTEDGILILPYTDFISALWDQIQDQIQDTQFFGCKNSGSLS